jgi:acylphosphatase
VPAMRLLGPSVMPPLPSTAHSTQIRRPPTRLSRSSAPSRRGAAIVVDQVTRRFRIIGKVQGVFFRQSTRVQAERLALTGYALNLPDGSVEVEVRGPAAAVEELRQWLHSGPRRARVDEVLELALELTETRPAPSDFEVR